MLDVLIAGAGPAGALAAIVLARRGARVLVVDRARFPRHKLCGDTLNPGALALLRHQGLAHLADAGLPLTGMIVTGPTGARVVGDYGSGLAGRSLTRSVFDASLVEAAAAAGAQVQEGVKVVGALFDDRSPSAIVRGALLEHRGRRMRVPALITIAADGRRSTLGVATGLLRHPDAPRRWAAGAYFTGVDGLGARGEMHVRRGHYIGVAPLPGGMANVCYVSADRRGFDDPATMMLRTIAADVQLRDRFRAAERVSDVTVVGPLAVDASTAGMPGLLLAGDAAGFVDPMTGDGMRLALHGGLLAAAVALDVLADPTLAGHELLARRRRDAFGRKLLVNRRLRALVARPSLVGAAAIVARTAPAVVRHAISYAGDAELDFTAVASRSGAGADENLSRRGFSASTENLSGGGFR